MHCSHLNIYVLTTQIIQAAKQGSEKNGFVNQGKSASSVTEAKSKTTPSNGTSTPIKTNAVKAGAEGSKNSVKNSKSCVLM